MKNIKKILFFIVVLISLNQSVSTSDIFLIIDTKPIENTQTQVPFTDENSLNLLYDEPSEDYFFTQIYTSKLIHLNHHIQFFFQTQLFDGNFLLLLRPPKMN